MIYILILIWLLPSILAIIIKANRGKIGEKRVCNILDKFPKDKYIPLYDVMLPTPNGTTQIDHIVVSIYGIFVIETKNYKGRIYGNDYSDKWTQNIYGNKRKFYSPLKQNYGHVKTLADLLQVDMDLFIPIVAFTQRAQLYVKSNNRVINTNMLYDTIDMCKTERLTREQVEDIVCKIVGSTVDNTRQNRDEHVKRIQTQVADTNRKIATGICPKCGSTLVKRSGKYGEFWGCSGYPKCKWTMKIE